MEAGLESAEKLAQILQTYGGWAMVVVLLVALYYLYKVTRNDIIDLREKRHVEFIAVLTEATKALLATASAQERASNVLESANDILNETAKSNARVVQAITFCERVHSIRPGGGGNGNVIGASQG